VRTGTRGLVAVAIFLVVVAGLLGSVASADETEFAFRPADTSSPQATLKEFIESCNELHKRIQSVHYFDGDSPEHHPVTARILDCLDTSDLPEYARLEASSEAAVCLKEILDRVELPPYKDIPDTKKIEDAGGLEQFSRWQIPGTRLTIVRVEEGPRRHEYLFSPGTVGRAVEYYRDVQAMPYPLDKPAVAPYHATGHLTFHLDQLAAVLIAEVGTCYLVFDDTLDVAAVHAHAFLLVVVIITGRVCRRNQPRAVGRDGPTAGFVDQQHTIGLDRLGLLVGKGEGVVSHQALGCEDSESLPIGHCISPCENFTIGNDQPGDRTDGQPQHIFQ
jgi:hypothetical protein